MQGGKKMSELKVVTYDCTPRDGEQSEGFQFDSAQDKLEYCRLAEEMLGIDVIEGGFVHPTQTKVLDFFELAKKHDGLWQHLAVFGGLCAKLHDVRDDAQVKALIDVHAPYITVVGKASSAHAINDLGLTRNYGLEENIRMIKETISYIKEKRKDATVIFDAEHAFRGFLEVPEDSILQRIQAINHYMVFDPSYTLRVLETAHKAGADWIVLCDTTGWVSSNSAFQKAMRAFREALPHANLGLHFHNDSARAAASTVDGVVEFGVKQVQGTFLGLGERTGNTNLLSVIGTLQGQHPHAGFGKYRCIPEQNLKNLAPFAERAAKRFRVPFDAREPFVGKNAYAHVAGFHHSAQENAKHMAQFWQPYQNHPASLVGSTTRRVVSDMAGKSTYLSWAYGNQEEASRIAQMVKDETGKGFIVKEAPDSFYLRYLEGRYGRLRPFEITKFSVFEEHREGGSVIEGVVHIKIGGKHEVYVADGDGPLHAVDEACRKALLPSFPELANLELVHWKPRDIEAKLGDSIHQGTARMVWVPIESRYHGRTFNTGAYGESSLNAGVAALVDSYILAILTSCRKFDQEGVYVK